MWMILDHTFDKSLYAFHLEFINIFIDMSIYVRVRLYVIMLNWIVFSVWDLNFL